MATANSSADMSAASLGGSMSPMRSPITQDSPRHLGASRATRAGAHRHRSDAEGCPAGGWHDRHRADRSNSNEPHWVIAALLWAKMAASWNHLFGSLYGGTCRG